MPKDAVSPADIMDFVLSSNPPNPKTSFRLGDWICSSPNCAAHNFGRNLSCIGCGSHRSPSSPPISARPPMSSPRFSSSPTPPPQLPHDSSHVLQKPSTHHPLLTPSGRAFAVGGKVQNISTDPLNPCIMFWPDNEPLPAQCQIRPSGLVGIPQPPILNTGNRGPISHQPGDWVCQKCNYLNWRRRKVCQTCLPYAEGNGDSISAAVQAERIALLTNVLSRTRLDPNGNFQGPLLPNTQQQDQIPVQRSHSLTPPSETTALGSATPLLQVSPPINLLRPNEAVAPVSGPTNGLHKSVQRSRSHLALGQQYQHQIQIQRHLAPTPIYQTPLPSSTAPRFAPELINPQHSSPLLQPQYYQQHQHQQMHRNPSPLPMPLLYSTGPPTSPFLGGASLTGNRMRVLSSPAPPASRDWSPRASASSGSGSRSSLGSLDIPQLKIRESESVSRTDGSGSGSELPTPAITSPLLPAFLRDVVSSPSGSKSPEEKEEEALGGRFVFNSPKSLDGVDLSPEEAVAWVRKSSYDGALNSAFAAAFPITSKTPIPNHPGPRARNDSGSSTCSTSSSSSSLSSNISTSGVSLSLSATSVSSGSGCCGAGLEADDLMKSAPGRRGSGPISSTTSSPSPTITTTVSSCPTPPADKGSTTTGGTPAVPAPTSSLPFMSFGNTGIWKMDGEESRSLKAFPVPPPAQSNQNRHGLVPSLHELQAPLLLPVGVEKRY